METASVDTETLETSLRRDLKIIFITLVNKDDADGLEDAILKEKTQLQNKKLKKESQAYDIKVESNFLALGRRILHYACAVDASECCRLLLTSKKFPRIRPDAVEEVDHRSALHFACLYHSQRCVEILLKYRANAALRNKQLMLPLEEFFLNSQLHVEWNLSTPAVEIVENVGKMDFCILRLLEPKCKHQLISVALKLAKGLKVVPLVALLHVAGNSIASSVSKISGEELSGTIIDTVLGVVLESSALSLSEKQSEKLLKCTAAKVQGDGETWPVEASSMYRKICDESAGTRAHFKKSQGEAHVVLQTATIEKKLAAQQRLSTRRIGANGRRLIPSIA